MSEEKKDSIAPEQNEGGLQSDWVATDRQVVMSAKPRMNKVVLNKNNKRTLVQGSAEVAADFTGFVADVKAREVEYVGRTGTSPSILLIGNAQAQMLRERGMKFTEESENKFGGLRLIVGNVASIVRVLS